MLTVGVGEEVLKQLNDKLEGKRPSRRSARYSDINGGLGIAPRKSYSGDAGYDLVVSEDVDIAPHTFADVKTGIAIELPHGVWARITGRSSTLRKRGVLVNEGIIDNGYRGELFIGAYNLTNMIVHIKQGERIAQLIPHEIVSVRWRRTDKLKPSLRGTSGFGSSGK